jgi:hypothetical protein
MFESFNETSRLYAKNFSVIEAVKSEFQREVDAFLDGVFQEMRTITSGRLREKRTAGSYRYWWIGEGEKDPWPYPYLWLDSSAVEIVEPGEVRLTAAAPKASPDQRHALASVAKRPEFTPFCTAGRPDSLFMVNIRYNDEHPVHHVARVAATFVLALSDVFEKNRIASGSDT